MLLVGKIVSFAVVEDPSASLVTIFWGKVMSVQTC